MPFSPKIVLHEILYFQFCESVMRQMHEKYYFQKVSYNTLDCHILVIQIVQMI